jgi:hypothetical protein
MTGAAPSGVVTFLFTDVEFGGCDIGTPQHDAAEVLRRPWLAIPFARCYSVATTPHGMSLGPVRRHSYVGRSTRSAKCSSSIRRSAASIG